MAVRFDLGSLAPDDRPEAIRALSRELNGQIEVGLPPNPSQVKAVTTSSSLGSADVSEIRWNVTSLRRTAGPMKDDTEPHVCVILQESGVSRFGQGGRSTEIRPGELVVLENIRPYEVSFQGAVHTALVRVPTHILGLPASLLGQVTAVRLGQDPIMDAATAFFSRLVRNQTSFGDTGGELFAQASIELIRAVVTVGTGREDLAREPLRHTLLERVLTYVRLHLAERELTAARIAAEHHVSVRQLYLTLSQAGISLGDWVRTARLEECRRELASPAHRFITITAIAYRWGFTSGPHFSRAFKAMYGMSPREWRRTNRAQSRRTR